MGTVITGTFLLLGGVALFLYGINFMSHSLEEAAGDNLRGVLQRMTKNGVMAVGVGALVTALIQSSGATSVMVLGFVTADMMNLSQALFTMLGANIGTTVTAQIIAFKIVDIAPLILFVGMLMYMFIHQKIVKKIGGVVLGFGLLFVGIYLMNEAVDRLNLSTLVSGYLQEFNHPLLSMTFGLLITSIIQSSSASIGILQVLVASGVTGGLGLGSLMYMILGMNIGAVAPVVIASFAGNKRSKSVAFAAFVAKVLGTLIFLIIYWLIPNGLIGFLERLSPNDISRQIANLHLMFNLVASLLLCPLVGVIVKITDKLFPIPPQDETVSQKLIYISPDSLLSPSIAITQTKREIMRMAHLTSDNLHAATDAFFDPKGKDMATVFETEKIINYLNHTISAFLVKLHGERLPEKDLQKVGMMFHVISDIERIGDHAENIAEYVEILQEKGNLISDIGCAELKTMSDHSVAVFDLALKVYDEERFDLLQTVSDMEEEVDDLQDQLTENHIKRLKSDSCNPRGGVMFTDMVTDLERCSDHAINIAFAIKGEKTSVEVKKTYITRLDTLS